MSGFIPKITVIPLYQLISSPQFLAPNPPILLQFHCELSIIQPLIKSAHQLSPRHNLITPRVTRATHLEESFLSSNHPPPIIISRPQQQHDHHSHPLLQLSHFWEGWNFAFTPTEVLHWLHRSAQQPVNFFFACRSVLDRAFSQVDIARSLLISRISPIKGLYYE